MNSAADKLPWWATPWACALLVLALTIPSIIFAIRFDLIGDEAYYAVWSLNPGFGYFDHSPGVAWVIWLGRMIFGESEFAVRALFIASGLATSAALYRIAVLLFGDARVGAVAAIGYTASPAILVTFTVATPDGPSTLFWTLTIWAIAEFVARRNANWWLLAGLFAGLGLLSKYTVVFLGAGLILYLISSRDRLGWLKLWQVWAGGLIAVLAFMPVVLIDWARNWLSFRFQLGRTSLDGRVFTGFYEFIRFQVEESLLLLPTLYVFLIIGIVFFFARRAKGLALPLLTATPMVAYFMVHALFGRVAPNWTAPLFPQLAFIGAWAVVSIRPTAAWLRWPLNALIALHVPVGLAIMLTAYTSIETRTVPFLGPVPAFDFVYGWENLQGKVAKLAHDNGAEWIDVPDYSLIGWLGYYQRIAGDPIPVFQTNTPYRYLYMPPMDETLRRAPHLVLEPTAAAEAPARDGARSLGIVTRDDADGRPLASYAVYLVPAAP